MYSVSPVYDHGIDIEIPKCIYTMQNLSLDNDVNPEFSAEEKDLNCLLDQLNGDLTGLDARLNSLITKFKNIETSTKVPSSSSSKAIKHNQRPPQIVSVVLHLTPKDNVPVSLVALIKLLASKGDFRRIRTYHHSSIRGLNCPVSNCFDNIEVTTNKNSSLDIIFKDVEYPTLIEDGNSTQIQGMASILRYFGRRLRPSYDIDVATSSIIDYFIDIGTSFNSLSAKQRSSVEKTLRQNIEKYSCVVEPSVSLADLSIYSAFKECKISMNGALEKWSKVCSATFNL